jgi:hypothetical protein
MRSYLAIFIFSFINWGIPLITSTFLLSLRQNERILYESIVPIVLSITTVTCTNLYFRYVNSNYAREGLIFGCFAFLIGFILDLLLFNLGPMRITFIDYVKDIGLTSLMIPVIALGIGIAVSYGSDLHKTKEF